MESANTELKGFVQETFNPFVEEVRSGFDEIRTRFDELLSAIHAFAHSVDQRFDVVDKRLSRVEATMVTKDYLDNKLADHGVRYGGLDRETNEKIYVLTDALVAEGSLSPGAATRVVTAEPFPRRKA
jgi:hypothetical protein